MVESVASAPRPRLRQRAGTQIARRPSTISAARITAITSNRWLTPPVGRGVAGSSISSRIATAKLFSENTSFSAPSVFGWSLRSHPSSWSLNGGSADPVTGDGRARG